MVEATNICGNCKYYESTDLWYLGICRKPLKTFCSCKDAGRWLKDIKKCRHITQVCNGVRKTAYGYKWAWLKDYQ